MNLDFNSGHGRQAAFTQNQVHITRGRFESAGVMEDRDLNILSPPNAPGYFSTGGESRTDCKEVASSLFNSAAEARYDEASMRNGTRLSTGGYDNVLFEHLNQLAKKREVTSPSTDGWG